jgi:hypothetical protein
VDIQKYLQRGPALKLLGTVVSVVLLFGVYLLLTALK